MKIKLDIEGMSCEHCVKHVTEALNEVSGVSDVSVSLSLTTIEIDDNVTEAHLKEVIDDAGYELNGITLAY